MERVIRHKETRRFLDSSGNWVSEAKNAKHFNAVAEAVDFCLERGIKSDVHLVFIGEFEFVVELFPD